MDVSIKEFINLIIHKKLSKLSHNSSISKEVVFAQRSIIQLSNYFRWFNILQLLNISMLNWIVINFLSLCLLYKEAVSKNIYKSKEKSIRKKLLFLLNKFYMDFHICITWIFCIKILRVVTSWWLMNKRWWLVTMVLPSCTIQDYCLKMGL